MYFSNNYVTYIGFGSEMFDSGQMFDGGQRNMLPNPMECEQEMPCQQQSGGNVLQPLQHNGSSLHHSVSPLQDNASPQLLQSANIPNRQYTLSALMENNSKMNRWEEQGVEQREEQGVQQWEEQEVERQEEEPIHVPAVINVAKPNEYDERIKLEAESVKGNNKSVNRSCGVGYSSNEEEKEFSDKMKDIIKAHTKLRAHKDLFRYMAYATTHRLYCGHCKECKNPLKLVDA